MLSHRTRFAAALAALAAAAIPSLRAAGPKDEPQPPKPGWVFQNPPDLVTLDAGRRNPLFYVGETVSFTAKGPAADRFEVRDYWGELVDKGPFAPTITVKPQPPGWYKIFVFGKPLAEPKKDPRTPAEQELDGDVTPQTKAKAAAAQAAWQYSQWYGDGVAGTTFVVVRDDPNFPKLPPKGKYPGPGTGDEVMRAVSGMGPQRHSADAAKPDESIKRLEAEIAADKELYLPGDPKRNRALFIAFGNGTKGHLDGVKKVVEHFKDTVKYYEPRNEPNGGSSGGDFVKNEMADFYKVVKGVDPSLKVIGPGTVSIGPNGSGLGFIEDYLKAGGADLIDGFSFHFYNALNGDLAMGRRSMDALVALLKKYNADKKELWQTEQGYFAAVYGAYQPRHQGRWTMLEMMLFEQYGLPKERNHLWYDVSHGFWDFPTWWENDGGGFNPALPLMRVYAEEVYGTRFSKAYDLGPAGNRLYLASLFEGETKRTAVFISSGATDGKIDLLVKGGPAKLHTTSAFGVESDLPIADGRATLPVGELPVWVDLAPGQTIDVVPQDFGPNLARADGVKADASGAGPHPIKAAIPNDISKLTNGELENWYYRQKDPDQPWMDASKTYPVTVDLTFPKPTDIARVIVWAPAPWQWQGTLVDYELQYENNGQWTTIEHVKQPLKTFQFLTPNTRTKVDSYFDNRHVFNHSFKPVTTTKIRLLIHESTWGGGATEIVGKAGGQTGPHHVMLQEIEVFAK